MKGWMRLDCAVASSCFLFTIAPAVFVIYESWPSVPTAPRMSRSIEL